MPTALEIIEAATVPKRHDRVFCIGSFAKRVNFLAQQRRALNLVWALHEEKRFFANERIAVIGGGLAGVTAAGALMAFGAKVDVFEKERRVLHLQRETTHRRVHPSINAWPHEALTLATDLPFFDWATGVCNAVADEIARDFERMMDEADNQIFTKTTAKDFAFPGTNMLRVVSTPAVTSLHGPSHLDGYSLAIITVGFGSEVNESGFNCESYWRNDNLEPDRDTVNEEYVVSGCGDGGLIDALRIVHENFDKGWLAFTAAAKLDKSPIARNLATAENQARSGGSLDALAKAYEAAATELMEKPRYSDLNGDLIESLKRFDQLVYLGDFALSKPYSLNSAPIHKLLVAHAILAGKITYEQGTIRNVDEEVHFSDLEFPPPPATKVVIRNGARPNFRKLMGRDAVTTLRGVQEGLSDDYAKPAWRKAFNYPVPPGAVSIEQFSDYIKTRKPMAKRLFEQLCPDAIVLARKDRFYIQLDADRPVGTPDEIFRIPVHYEPDVESAPL